MRERDYGQGVFDAYQSWKAVATTQHDFIIAPDAPGRPASPAELFAGFEAQYKAGIERFIDRVDKVIGALSPAASGNGVGGGIEAKAQSE
jgi:hypothetical protein